MHFLGVCSLKSQGALGEFVNHRGEMEASMKYIFLLGFFVVVGIAGVDRVNGAGECGRVPVESEAYKMAPCVFAGQYEQVDVSSNCCRQVKRIGQNPSCLCAVMLSDTAKSAGVQPEIAMTIPKRCNMADRPVGYKCGAYTLP